MSCDALTLEVKRGHTTRFPGELTWTATGEPFSLVDKTIVVAFHPKGDESAAVTLTVGAGVGITSDESGLYWFEITAANLATLGDPDNLTINITVYNADNSIALADRFDAEVNW